MARPLQSLPFVAKRHPRGFTLIEMMIVVVIVGVLAMLAVVGFRKLVQSSHVSEATNMVQNIRVAQEAYHSETQQYANISNDLTSWYPAAPQHDIQTGWGAACSNCTTQNWSALPLHVDGPVLFGYATVAGTPGDAPPPANTASPTSTSKPTFPATSATDWYVIAARGDLDGNTSTYTDVYGTSWTNQIFVVNEGQ